MLDPAQTMLKSRLFKVVSLGMALLLAAPSMAQERKLPYWAAITANDALMRTGPGRNYPATWRYRRAQLPVQVVQIHESWRKVRDRDGTEGWMAAVLLSAKRSALVVGNVLPMYAAPDTRSRLRWRAEPGVVGKIRHCADGWCEFDVKGKTGYVETRGLWGVSADETVD